MADANERTMEQAARKFWDKQSGYIAVNDLARFGDMVYEATQRATIRNFERGFPEPTKSEVVQAVIEEMEKR